MADASIGSTLIAATGAGAGQFDTNTLVKGLVDAEGVPATAALDKKQEAAEAKISAYASLKSAMSTFQVATTDMKKESNFYQRTATSTDTNVFTASTTGKADPGTYSVKVTQTAQKHSLASDAFTNINADTLGTGTLTIKFGTYTYSGDNPTGFTQDGTKSTLTLAIDSTNNTLEGIKDAINGENKGVTASIVNDGSGYRLVLASSETGAENGMEITVDDGDGNDTNNTGLSQLAYSNTTQNITQTMKGQDANLTINGLDITSASNTVEGAIEDVTLNIVGIDATNTKTLTIGKDTQIVSDAINSFADAYNTVRETIKDLTSYTENDEDDTAPLMSDSATRTVINQIRRELTDTIQGISGSYTSLPDIGVSLQRDGTLKVDQDKLDTALLEKFDEVGRLFSESAVADNSAVKHISSTSDTQPGDYKVSVIQPATQGAYAAGDTASTFNINDDNDTFVLKVDGTTSGTITLTQDNYADGATLAAEMQSQINGDSTLTSAGKSVSVSYSDTTGFSITSSSYGQDSTVEITTVDTDTASELKLSVAKGKDGKDIVGAMGDSEVTRGEYIAGTAASTFTVNGNNNDFTIKVDSISADITIGNGNHGDGATLAAEIQSQINADTTLLAAGKSVEVSYDTTNGFSITSTSFGTTSKVEITAIDNNSDNLGLSVKVGTDGVGEEVTQGKYKADSTASTFTIDADNDTIALKVDGVSSGSITLTQAAYGDGDSLAAHMQEQINAASAFSLPGVKVAVSYDATNGFQITSERYGTSSKVEVTSVDVDTASELGLSVKSGTDGEGDSVVNGVGRFMTGTTGDTKGLQLEISAVSVGYYDSIHYGHGVAKRLDDLMTTLLSSDGVLTTRENGLNEDLDEISEDRDDLTERLAKLEERYRKEYSMLDALMGQMEQTSDMITAMIDALNPKD